MFTSKLTSQRIVTTALLVLIGSIAAARPNEGLVLEWQSRPDGRSSLVLTAKDKPVTICMTGSHNLKSAQMAPTDTYYTGSYESGPILLRPFCHIETYDEHGGRIGRNPFDGRSILEAELRPPGYALKLELGDRISLDREWRDKPFRVVVRLPIFKGESWTECILEKTGNP